MRRIPVAIPTAGIRAVSITGRKALERKRFGNHYKAYEFEYQAVTDARGQDGRGRTLVT